MELRVSMLTGTVLKYSFSLPATLQLQDFMKYVNIAQNAHKKLQRKFPALHPVCIRQFYLHGSCSEHKGNQLFFPEKISYLDFTKTFPPISVDV